MTRGPGESPASFLFWCARQGAKGRVEVASHPARVASEKTELSSLQEASRSLKKGTYPDRSWEESSPASWPSGTDEAGKCRLGTNHRQHRLRYFRRYFLRHCRRYCYHHHLEVWGRGSQGQPLWHPVLDHPRVHPRGLTPGVNPETPPGLLLNS